MTLDAANTTTTVAFDPLLSIDQVTLNGILGDFETADRVTRRMDRFRAQAHTDLKARVISRNSFPTGPGLAALTVAASSALGLELTKVELGRMARLGSGSTCRSIDGGFVEWYPGEIHEESFAAPITLRGDWDLFDIIAIVSST